MRNGPCQGKCEPARGEVLCRRDLSRGAVVGEHRHPADGGLEGVVLREDAPCGRKAARAIRALRFDNLWTAREVFNELTDEEIVSICGKIKAFYGK